MGADGPRVVIRTLGCKVNRTESEALGEVLLGSGVTIVTDEAGADVAVVNTCTVTGEADAKARKAVRHALSAFAGPVVVIGCLANVDPQGLQLLDPRVIVEADRAKVAERVAAAIGAPLHHPASPLRVPGAFRTRVMVKVQDGCDHRCAYCIVPDARGLPSSVPARDVEARVRALVVLGTGEVVLTGVNIGRYSDGPAAHDLTDLVRIVAATGVPRVRVSSVEPMDLTDRFLDGLSGIPGIAPHLHVPVQSGCDRTLLEMGRGYIAADYAARLEAARAAIPGLAVTTDVMVGFPGETEDDFRQSLEFVEACGFTKLHVFRYSQRAGTPAADRTDQVEPAVKAARATAMRTLSDRLADDHATRSVGRRATVLVERVEGDRAVGTAGDHLVVRIRPAEGLARGTMLEVLLTGVEGSSAVGVPAAG